MVWSDNTEALSLVYIYIYKAILGVLPSYLCSLLMKKSVGNYSLRSQDVVLFSVPHVSTVLGKKAFVYSAPSTWNLLQNNLKLSKLIPLSVFKLRMRSFELDSLTCQCFR